MTKVNQLLKYQEVDSKLLDAEREVANSEEWKNYSQAKSYLTKTSEKLDSMDAKAHEMTQMLDALNKKYAEIEEALKNDFNNISELVDQGGDLTFYKKKITNILNSLKSIKSEANALMKAIKEADEGYQAVKEKTISVQKDYKVYLDAYNAYYTKKIGEIEPIKSELKQLAESIDKDVLDKYKAKRSQRIFPILCKVTSGRCPKCGMELTIMDKEKISAGNFAECDNCHRILYGE